MVPRAQPTRGARSLLTNSPKSSTTLFKLPIAGRAARPARGGCRFTGSLLPSFTVRNQRRLKSLLWPTDAASLIIGVIVIDDLEVAGQPLGRKGMNDGRHTNRKSTAAGAPRDSIRGSIHDPE